MATIAITPDNTSASKWNATWVERGEIVAHIEQDMWGNCHIRPVGTYYNPMKSFAGNVFQSPDEALAGLKIYFGDR